FDVERLMQRIESHERDGSGAVRVGDDTLMPFYIARVDFRNDQGNFFVHPEGAGIVDDNATRLRCNRREFLRNASAGAEKSDINPLEGVLFELLNSDFFAAEFQLFSDRTGRGEQRQRPDREIAFLQGFQHLNADGASSADHCHMRFLIHTKSPKYTDIKRE